MRADQDVHPAGFRLRDDLLLLGGGTEPAEHFDANRERRHALPERGVVLERQHGGGREHRDLLAVLRHFERRAHGQFGLAVTHVAAKQTVHRVRVFQVLFQVGERRDLIGCFLKGECVLEFLLPRRVEAEGGPAAHLALRVHAEQFLRHVAQRLLDPRFGPCPGGAAQAIEVRLGAVAARAILFHQIESLKRHVEPRFLLERQQHEVARRSAHRQFAQAAIHADAVVHVHHIIARLEVAQVGDEARNRRAFLACLRAPGEAAEDVVVGQESQLQIGEDEAEFDFAARQQDGTGGCRLRRRCFRGRVRLR